MEGEGRGGMGWGWGVRHYCGENARAASDRPDEEAAIGRACRARTRCALSDSEGFCAGPRREGVSRAQGESINAAWAWASVVGVIG